MKAHIFGELILKYINGRIWKIINPEQKFYAIVGEDELSLQHYIIVSDGFNTDFASIPRFFWRILPPTGDGSKAEYGYAAVIHDWLYARHKTDRMTINRKFADDVFLTLMISLKVEKWKRNVMYRAVRMFGWAVWNKWEKRKDELEEQVKKYLPK
jgi:hypothetical protein